MKGQPTASRVRDGWRRVLVVAGRVVDVDPNKWTCTVVTEVGQKTLRNVGFGASYLHPFDGEGSYVMPEAGAAVWACRSSEGDYPYFILAYRGYPSRDVKGDTRPSAPDMRTNRPRLSPGEISMQTRDRNGVVLRRGGMTEIFGSPLAKTTYSARRGRVRTLAKNYEVETFGGSFRWKTEREEKDPDGRAPTRLETRVKEFANDKGHVVRMETGGHVDAAENAEEVSQPTLTVQVFQDGDKSLDAAQVSASLSVDKQGQTELRQEGQLTIKVGGPANAVLKMKANGEVELKSDSKTTINASGAVRIESAAKVTTKGATGPLATSTQLDGTGMKVGLGTAPALYDLGFSEAMAAALAEVIVIGKIAGAPSTAALEELLSKFASGTFTSKKLTTE